MSTLTVIIVVVVSGFGPNHVVVVVVVVEVVIVIILMVIVVVPLGSRSVHFLENPPTKCKGLYTKDPPVPLFL